MSAATRLPEAIYGDRIELRPWDAGTLRQMAGWGERGFPFHAFDMGHLRDPRRLNTTLAWSREQGPHRHFAAYEGDLAVGRCSVNLRDDSGLYLWAVHVPPEHEGRGVCRRMLAALMTWLEGEFESDFVLSSNTFATHAHSAYYALGFRVAETRWHFDREIADLLWKVPSEEREPLTPHIRFHNGRWEVRVHIMRRRRGAPMETGGARVR